MNKLWICQSFNYSFLKSMGRNLYKGDLAKFTVVVHLCTTFCLPAEMGQLKF
jgi:hypothetical protein